MATNAQLNDLLSQLLGQGGQRSGVSRGGVFSPGGTTFSQRGDGTTFEQRGGERQTGAVSTAGPSVGKGLGGSPMDLFRPPVGLLEALFKPGASTQDIQDEFQAQLTNRAQMNWSPWISLGGSSGGRFPISIFQANPKAHSDPRVRSILEGLTRAAGG